MKRYVVMGATFVAAGTATFAVLVILAMTNVWDVSKFGSFAIPLVTAFAAAFSVGKKAVSKPTDKT